MGITRIFFLFPGQGAQYPGMGLDLLPASPAARAVFDTASEVLGFDMAGLIRNADGEALRRTGVSQPALAAVSLAAAACLGEKGVVPAACAGFSLGEYPALACAGVIGPEDCFRLTGARGRAMQDAVDRMAAAGRDRPGMSAVLGLDSGKVEALIAQWKDAAGSVLGDLYAANINSSKQVVVSGPAAALAEAERRFREAGARRCVRLRVDGPFHSPLMKPAAEAFAPVLEGVCFKDPAIPFFSNVTGGEIRTGTEAKALALRQIVEGVRWTQEEAALAEKAPEAVAEAGPGRVLQGLWQETGSAVPCYGAGTLEDIGKVKELV
ncbi:MAG: ACP S-malonyltransferase [Treponema sp.]|jgi:[acyl-carrier-protein] S-malonyltransferase|nr:ACP S-malonyltransferase [Treponema sp.]